MTKVTWGGIKVCPVPGCNKGHDGGPYMGPMVDLGKHVVLSRDFPHTARMEEHEKSPNALYLVSQNGIQKVNA